MPVVQSARPSLTRRVVRAVVVLCSAIVLAACSTQVPSVTLKGGVVPPQTVPLGFNGVNTGPMPSFGELLFPAGPPNTTIRIPLGQIPANETASYLSAAPPGVFLVSTFVGGVVFSVGPNPVPVSSVSNVVITFPSAPAGRIGGYINELGPGGSAPLTVSAAVSGQPTGQTYTAPPQANTPVLTTLAPNTSYFIFLGYM